MLASTDKPIILCQSLAKVFDISGALVLQQLQYWIENKPAVKDGERWHYITANTLAEQIGVLTEQTVRKKLKSLEELGVLITGVYNQKAYDRTKWYRIDYKVLCRELSLKLGTEWSPIPLPSGTGYRIQELLYNGPIQENKKENRGCRTSVKKNLHAKQQEKSTPEVLQGKTLGVDKKASQNVKENVMAESDEILKKMQEKSKGASTPNTKMGLCYLWQKRMASLTGTMSPALTGKESGQLSQFLKKCGDQSTQALDYALNNWSKFTWEVRTKKNYSSAPEVPMTGYVLAHADVLLQLIAQKAEQPKPVMVVKPKPAPIVKPVPEPEDKPSKEQILADIAYFQQLAKEKT